MKKIIIFFSVFLSVLSFSQGKMKDYSNILKSKNIYEIDAFLRDAHPDDPRRSVLKPRLIDLLYEYIKTAHPEDQRVREMQEKLAILKRKPSTRITFEEMTANIKMKQMQKYKEELARRQSQAYTKATKPSENISENRNTEAPKKNTSAASPVQPTASSSTYTAKKTETANPEQEEFNMLMNESDVEHKNKTVKILNALFDNDPNSKETTVLIENKSDCDLIMRIEGTGHTKYRLPVPAKAQNTIVVEKGQYLFSSLVCGAQYASQKTVQKAIMVSLGSSKK